MRTLAKNKRNMKYAKFNSVVQEYQKDDDGNIMYQEIDGELVPTITGSPIKAYSHTVDFRANISSTLNKLHAEAWGVSQSNIYSEINCIKGYLPLEIGDVVWRENEVRILGNGTPDASSADYTVMGIMTEGISEDYFLLQRNDVSKDE